MLVADSTKFRRSAPVRIADISQINTFVTDAALPARLAEICHTRGIQVVEAMPGSLEADEAETEPRSSVG
jgi:DeoR family transcriptional regulator, glycerol-3-phosphate regulon repressor